jgi:hypothetical protein
MTDTATDPVLRVTLVADKSDGTERVKRYDPETGHAYLADPSTWRRDDPTTWQETPWPLLGVKIDNKPTRTRVATSFVVKGIAGGWLTLDGIELAHRPGGPAEDPWRSTHTFTHAKTLTLHTLDGDVVYNIVHQPDKYACSEKADLLGDHDTEYDNNTPVTPEVYNAGHTRVDHFYELELVNA